MKVQLLFLCLVLMVGSSCSRGGKKRHNDDSAPSTSDPKPPIDPPPPGEVSGDAIVPRTAQTPFGLTWTIGFNQNVSMQELQAWYQRMLRMNQELWDISEGQVYVGKVIIKDNVNPSATANNTLGQPVTGELQMLVFVGSSWDEPGADGYVEFDENTGNRYIGLPEAPRELSVIHEASHMIFDLSWSSGPALWDEYQDGFQDDACIMEAIVGGRWCGADNHQPQSSQPTSCWGQILNDYPNFKYAGTNTANSAVPVMEVEYVDQP